MSKIRHEQRKWKPADDTVNKKVSHEKKREEKKTFVKKESHQR